MIYFEISKSFFKPSEFFQGRETQIFLVACNLSYIYVGEFLRIARATLRMSDFVPKGIDLVSRMLNQGGDQKSVEHFLLKIIRRHPDSFSQFSLRPEDIIRKCFP